MRGSLQFWMRIFSVAIALPCSAFTSQLTLEALPSRPYGMGNIVTATLRYSGPSCDGYRGRYGYTLLTELVSVTVDGFRLPPPIERTWSSGRTCDNGEWTERTEISLGQLHIGDHTVVVRYEGETGISAATSAPLPFHVAPDAIGSAPGVLGMLAAGMSDLIPGGTQQYCYRESAVLTFTATPDAPDASAPANERFPYGFVNYRAYCNYNCGYGLCPPGPDRRAEQRLQIVFPGPVPPGSTVWAYMPNALNPSPGWQIIPASIQANRVTVKVQGGLLTGLQMADYLLHGTIALSIPAGLSTGHDWQGMWGTSGEDGWGLSIAQQGDRLFSVLYVYDLSGSPAWLALGDGAWDATRSAFGGRLYRPLAPTGAAIDVGSAWLSFSAPGRGAFRYTIDGRHGEKRIERMPSLNPMEPGRYAGVWDEVPRGGGLTIDVAGRSLFVGWPMFRPSGEPSWLVMPEGRWSSPNVFEGALYGTRSSAWLATAYDVRQFEARPVGHMRITFADDNTGTLEYTVDGTPGTNTIVRRRF